NLQGRATMNATKTVVNAKNLSLGILAVAGILSLGLANAAWAESDCNAETFGAGVDLEETTAIASILAAPGDFDGKAVRVEGQVHEVCRMAGCWMEIVGDDDSGTPLKVKVEDGVIVFPVSTRGHKAIAQGTVEVKEMDRERYVAHQQHLADEMDETFDEASIGDGPFHSVQVLGTGAEVCSN
ncbi:MAG: DUF4920 domain-containing protein, partial [Thermoanaerobaculia bacterium]|nr:DUF4920 domain-containing protein [Thermoanaerobaculia bacterium]